MLKSLQEIRHAEANFVLARHHIEMADIDLAHEYSNFVINNSVKHLNGNIQYQDPLLIADTLAEVVQLGFQTEDDELALKAVTSAFDIASLITEKDAFSRGWTYGFAEMSKAKINILSDIFSEEPSEESYEKYRLATELARLSLKRELSIEASRLPSTANTTETARLIGKRTEMSMLDTLNNANRARRIGLFAVHTGVILDCCDIYVHKNQDTFRVSSDIEMLSEDLDDYKKPQIFIQVKRDLRTQIGKSDDYLDHIKVLDSIELIGREDLRELEYSGFVKSPKPLRERVRTKIIDFVRESSNTDFVTRNYDRLTFEGVPLIR